MFKIPEDIRKDLGLTQTQFAQLIGMKYRSYQLKINENPRWSLSETIELCNLNNGDVKLPYVDGKIYNITISEESD